MKTQLNAKDDPNALIPPQPQGDPVLGALKTELLALREFINLNTLSPEIKAYKQGEFAMLSAILLRLRDRA